MPITIFRPSTGEQTPIDGVATLKELIHSGEVKQDDLCFYPGAQDWVPVSHLYIEGESIQLLPPRPHGLASDETRPPDTENSSEYGDLPWYRRSEVNVALMMGGIFCVPTNLITWFALMTGQVYTKNRASDGSLRPWSWLMRVAATLLLIFQLFVCAGIAFVFVAAVLHVPAVDSAQLESRPPDRLSNPPSSSTGTRPRSYDLERIIEEQRRRIAERREKAETSRPVESLDEAREAILGPWTHVGSDILGGSLWQKLVFKADGTVENYTARPAADDWGAPEILTWEPMTDKYSDTGRRYYGIRVFPWISPMILKNSETLSHNPADDGAILFSKGDRFPFSK